MHEKKMTWNNATFFASDGYPPKMHLLRDLRLFLTFQERNQATIHAPVAPEICSDNGSIHVGVLATLIDVLGGFLAMETFFPDWMATANLSIHSTGRVSSGVVSATGRVMRSGRRTATVSAEVFSSKGKAARSMDLAGSGMITYSRLAGVRAGSGAGFDKGGHVVDFQLPGGNARLGRHLIDQSGIQFVEEKPGKTVLRMTEYVCNSFGSLQGGMIAMMADVAGQSAARAATGHRLTTVDLVLQYLSPGRFGPFTTDTRVLRSNNASALSRVEVRDAGDDHRIVAVVMNTATLEDSALA
jgi:uncharacterized protein (TIGR00369 family)